MNTSSPDDGPCDPIAAVTHPDPYPYYAALARREGLWFDATLRLHVAASPAAVHAVLAHEALRVRPAAEPVPRHLESTAAGGLFARLVRMNDGPRHAALKPLLARALAEPGGTQALMQIAARHARERAAALGVGRDPRAIDAWVRCVPAIAMAEYVGFPRDAAADVAREVDAFVSGFAPPSGADSGSGRIDAAAVAAASLLARADRLVAATPAQRVSAHAAPHAAADEGDGAQAPSPRVAGRVIAAAAEAGVEPSLVAANLVGLVSQTFEATAGLLGNCLVALVRAAHARRERGVAGDETADGSGMLLPADDETADGSGLLRLAANEGADTNAFLRLAADVSRDDPSVHNTRRVAGRACEVLGVSLPAGAPVLVVLAAANRAAGDRHHEFGAAAHACPGSDAALALAASALHALLHTGFDPAALSGAIGYRPLPNARLPVFFPGERRA